jgi:hypothetical protein
MQPTCDPVMMVGYRPSVAMVLVAAASQRDGATSVESTRALRTE